jgi:hypothetical protein
LPPPNAHSERSRIKRGDALQIQSELIFGMSSGVMKRHAVERAPAIHLSKSLSAGGGKKFLRAPYKKMLCVGAPLYLAPQLFFGGRALFGGATLTLRLRVEKHPRHYRNAPGLTPARALKIALRKHRREASAAGKYYSSAISK